MTVYNVLLDNIFMTSYNTNLCNFIRIFFAQQILYYIFYLKEDTTAEQNLRQNLKIRMVAWPDDREIPTVKRKNTGDL